MERQWPPLQLTGERCSELAMLNSGGRTARTLPSTQCCPVLLGLTGSAWIVFALVGLQAHFVTELLCFFRKPVGSGPGSDFKNVHNSKIVKILKILF
jgi:hypothetical protein